MNDLDSKIYSIRNKKSNQWSSICCKIEIICIIVTIVIIKCVDSTIKCVDFELIHYTIKYVDFELIHYTINLNVISSFMVFSNFDYMFSIDVLLV